MSRFEGDGDEEYPGQWWLWEHNLKRNFSGKKGQQSLRELRDALLELPEKRLIAGRLADETGAVCAIGALAVHRQGREVIPLLQEIIPEDPDGWDAEEATMDYGMNLGLKRVMVIEIGYQNDEYHRDETPGQRYARVLAWVEKVIQVPA